MTRRTLGLVIGREIRERARSKALLGSTLFTLLLIVGVIAVPALLGRRPVTHQIGVVGAGNQEIVAAAETLLTSEEDRRPVTVEMVPLESEGAAREALETDRVDVVLVEGRRLLTDRSGGFGPSDLEQALQRAASSVQVSRLISEQGDAAARVVELLTTEPLAVENLAGPGAEEQARRGLIAYGGLVLMYMAVLSYAIYTLTGVTEEKSNRVVEVLLAAVKPWQLLAGKIIGIGVLGLGQMVLTVAAALVAIELTDAIELPTVPLDSGVALVSWFVLGYALYAVAFGTAGALVSRMEDAQSASAPLTIVALVGFFASFAVLDDPGSVLAVVTTFIPFTAPYVVPIRVALQAIPAWQLAASVALTVATTAGLVRVAGRVYAGGLLHFSGRMKWKEAWRSAES